jgi:hypothetical protein
LNEVELAASTTFKYVCGNFLGNNKLENYQKIVERLSRSYEAIGFDVSLKIRFLQSHLDFFPQITAQFVTNMESFFIEEIAVMEKRYQGNWSVKIMSIYCWSVSETNYIQKSSVKNF